MAANGSVDELKEELRAARAEGDRLRLEVDALRKGESDGARLRRAVHCLEKELAGVRGAAREAKENSISMNETIKRLGDGIVHLWAAESAAKKEVVHSLLDPLPDAASRLDRVRRLIDKWHNDASSWNRNKIDVVATTQGVATRGGYLSYVDSLLSKHEKQAAHAASGMWCDACRPKAEKLKWRLKDLALKTEDLLEEKWEAEQSLGEIRNRLAAATESPASTTIAKPGAAEQPAKRGKPVREPEPGAETATPAKSDLDRSSSATTLTRQASRTQSAPPSSRGSITRAPRDPPSFDLRCPPLPMPFSITPPDGAPLRPLVNNSSSMSSVVSTSGSSRTPLKPLTPLDYLLAHSTMPMASPPPMQLSAPYTRSPKSGSPSSPDTNLCWTSPGKRQPMKQQQQQQQQPQQQQQLHFSPPMLPPSIGTGRRARRPMMALQLPPAPEKQARLVRVKAAGIQQVSLSSKFLGERSKEDELIDQLSIAQTESFVMGDTATTMSPSDASDTFSPPMSPTARRVIRQFHATRTPSPLPPMPLSPHRSSPHCYNYASKPVTAATGTQTSSFVETAGQADCSSSVDSGNLINTSSTSAASEPVKHFSSVAVQTLQTARFDDDDLQYSCDESD
ncbi:hypothetical protein DIPPA_30661 [Diplonema papillatum]|nr:hypothetical protein DIPPA_30661 [Diplonema papillatum]